MGNNLGIQRRTLALEAPAEPFVAQHELEDESEEEDEFEIERAHLLLPPPLRRATKRRRRSASLSSVPDSPTPKKSKLNTPEYIHQNLFVEGKKSDVKIVALGHTWNLHTIYLEQCQYFRALFNGSWNDSDKDEHNLEIHDSNITFAGLNNTFACLYHNEIALDVMNVGSVLASAAMLGMNDLVDRCEQTMTETMSEENILNYLYYSYSYGCAKFRIHAFQLLSRMFWKWSENPNFLANLTYPDFVRIISSPELCICEGEKDLYTAVKRYLYILQTNSIDFNESTLNEYFHGLPPKEMYKYKDILKHIRLQHLLTSKKTVERLKLEHIYDIAHIEDVKSKLWDHLLSLEDRHELQPNFLPLDFYSNCRRLGRFLEDPMKCWRWAGYDYGLDLLIKCHAGLVMMVRNFTRDHGLYQIALKKHITIQFRMLILNSNGDVVCDSGLRRCQLAMDQKEIIFRLDPAHRNLSFHFFYINNTPSPSFRSYWNDISNTSQQITTETQTQSEDLIEDSESQPKEEPCSSGSPPPSQVNVEPSPESSPGTTPEPSPEPAA